MNYAKITVEDYLELSKLAFYWKDKNPSMALIFCNSALDIKKNYL